MGKSSRTSWRKFAYLFRTRVWPGSGKFKSRKRVLSKAGLYPESRCFALIFLALSFYFIAANTGSGWIYLLSATLITAVCAGFFLPIAVVNNVKASQEAPNQSIAGQTVNVVLRFQRKYPGPACWLRLAYEIADLDQKGKASPPVVIANIDNTSSFTLSTRPLGRGVHRLGNIVISSSYPLGLVWAQKLITGKADRTITVYPRTVPVDGFFLFKFNSSQSGAGGGASGARAVRQSAFTRGIREYTRGDSPRIIHWASSARTGRLLVREFEAEGMPRFDVLLNLAAPWQSEEQFELAVCAAASLLSLGHRMGLGSRIRLNPDISSSFQIPNVIPGMQFELEILARVKPVPSKPVSSSATPNLDRSRSLVLIQPGGAPALPGNYHLVEVEADGDDGLETSNPPACPHGGKLLKSVIRKEEDIIHL